MIKSMMAYEAAGDKLAAEGRVEEAIRAYGHAMDDCCMAMGRRPQMLADYLRLMDKRMSLYPQAKKD